ncbi:rRNA methyltransferase 2, mitochondrial-like [Amphibalanus amphitrite]|nr:rRNA methyltransferase 2, mitochondrial-like [Amphibalanus amphitrite]
MAPAASGVRALDQQKILSLAYDVARFALRHLAADGAMVVKLWAGGGEPELRQRLTPFFERVVTLKPAASRSDSAELYVAATGFRGASRADPSPTPPPSAVGY